MTNYERIKGMSVEEMAEFMVDCNEMYAIRIGNIHIGVSKYAFEKWLNSEVEE